VAELRPEAGADLPAAAPASPADPEQGGADAMPTLKVAAEEPHKLAAKGSPAEMAMAIAIPAPITPPVLMPAAVPAAKNPPVVGAAMVPAAKKRIPTSAVAKPTATFAVAKPAAAPAVAQPAATPAVAKPAATPAVAKPAAAPAVAQPAAESHPAEQQLLTPMTEAVVNHHQATSSEKPPETRGIVIASLRGDLKMVIAGDNSIKLLVTFREFPKARRNRVQTRAEAKREQRIVPVFVRTQQETREAVIETAREGIYLFSAEPVQGEPAKATFTLKLFETGSREKVIQIGTRNISGQLVLAKILMPEGILWDDEAAFTGSLEDSNSTTKFNAQTGLYWREYND
jgi:hypothetical protein